MIHPIGELARMFTIDWLDRADAAVPEQIMTPDYQVHIGTAELTDRASYVTGTLGQLELFPGLQLTVHDLLTDGQQLALVFTEHGASARHEGRSAAWRGVALFRCVGGRLAENWTQEDYWSRRGQLASGEPATVPSPAVAPWTTAPQPAHETVEQVVRAWLADPELSAVEVDDGSPLCLDVDSVQVRRLFSAGPRVAFAVTWSGPWRRGPGDAAGDGRVVELGACGVVDVRGSVVVGGHVVTDRHSLSRAVRR